MVRLCSTMTGDSRSTAARLPMWRLRMEDYLGLARAHALLAAVLAAVVVVVVAVVVVTATASVLAAAVGVPTLRLQAQVLRR